MSGLGLHHIHRRKRIYVKHQPYPHPDKWKRFLDKSAYFFAVFGPVMTIPQALRIWIGKDASGVSPISWSAYLVVAVFWLTYGIVHKAKPIIFTNCLWIVFEIMIISGTLVYG
jgi:uncharacterized protein with PQ loop repeat